jgi:hypothetical protein
MWTAHPKCFSWDTSDTIRQKVDRKHLQPKHGENVLDDIRMTVNTGLVLGTRTFADSLKNFQASSRLSRSKVAQRMLGKCKFYSDPIYPTPFIVFLRHLAQFTYRAVSHVYGDFRIRFRGRVTISNGDATKRLSTNFH